MKCKEPIIHIGFSTQSYTNQGSMNISCALLDIHESSKELVYILMGSNQTRLSYKWIHQVCLIAKSTTYKGYGIKSKYSSSIIAKHALSTP